MPGKPPSEVLYDSATALRQVDSVLAELGADDGESQSPSLSRDGDTPLFRAIRDCRDLLAALRISLQKGAAPGGSDSLMLLDKLQSRFDALTAAAAEHAAHCPAGVAAAAPRKGGHSAAA